MFLLATNNPHKAEELAKIFGDGIGNVITFRDLEEVPAEPEEDGDTLEANAYIKAVSAFAATGIPSLADDTGLEVDALDGAPGVYSARYAGENVTYQDNCNKLLHELSGVPMPQRTARFRTVICYVDEVRTLFAEGMVEGIITDAPRGTNGFGYDPVFQPEESQQTFAEMTAEAKNAISHRGRAIGVLRDCLQVIEGD